MQITAKDPRKRKLDLMGDDSVVQRTHNLLVPLLTELGFGSGEIVDLSALIATESKPVKLSWHRDRPRNGGIHSFQIPLLPGDKFHQLVPGSHKRALTPEEISARNSGGRYMPEALAISLDVGDVLLRSPLILHRGYNERGVERLTLVGALSER